MTPEEFKKYFFDVVGFGNNANRKPGIYNLDNVVCAVNIGGEEIIKFDSFGGFNLAYAKPGPPLVNYEVSKYPILCEKDGVWYKRRGCIEVIRDQIANGCEGWRPANEFLRQVVSDRNWGDEREYHDPSERRVAIRRALYLLSAFPRQK